MQFYRTCKLNVPGPGDYETVESKINLKKKSPRATIGKEKRFLDKNEQMTVTYKDPITIQHIKESAEVGTKKPQMGCIGMAPRLSGSRYILQTPGVGAYNLGQFASFSKAN